MHAARSPAAVPNIAFVALREHDLEWVAKIEASVYPFPWTFGNFRDSMLSGYDCWGCWSSGELIGYAIVMRALDEAHLLNIAVAPHWQGRGVGAAFLQYLIDRARREKQDMLYLEVRPTNVIGRHLYARFGFKQLGIRRDYYPAVTGREDALFLGLNTSDKLI